MKRETVLSLERSTLVRLHELSDRLWREHDLRTGLEQLIDAGVAQLGADMGHVQMLHPTKRVLETVAHRGFDPDFLAHFREVSALEDTACGRSLVTGERVCGGFQLKRNRGIEQATAVLTPAI